MGSSVGLQCTDGHNYPIIFQLLLIIGQYKCAYPIGLKHFADDANADYSDLMKNICNNNNNNNN